MKFEKFLKNFSLSTLGMTFLQVAPYAEMGSVITLDPMTLPQMEVWTEESFDLNPSERNAPKLLKASRPFHYDTPSGLTAYPIPINRQEFSLSQSRMNQLLNESDSFLSARAGLTNRLSLEAGMGGIPVNGFILAKFAVIQSSNWTLTLAPNFGFPLNKVSESLKEGGKSVAIVSSHSLPSGDSFHWGIEAGKNSSSGTDYRSQYSNSTEDGNYSFQSSYWTEKTILDSNVFRISTTYELRVSEPSSFLFWGAPEHLTSKTSGAIKNYHFDSYPAQSSPPMPKLKEGSSLKRTALMAGLGYSYLTRSFGFLLGLSGGPSWGTDSSWLGSVTGGINFRI